MPNATLIDVSKCTGCRACQVACKAWNDLPAEETSCFGCYENPPDLSANTWSRVAFYEVEREGLVGVRVKAGSASVEWSIDEYLDHFTETLGHVFPGRIGASGGPPGEERAADEAGPNARRRTQASAEPGHG